MDKLFFTYIVFNSLVIADNFESIIDSYLSMNNNFTLDSITEELNVKSNVIPLLPVVDVHVIESAS